MCVVCVRFFFRWSGRACIFLSFSILMLSFLLLLLVSSSFPSPAALSPLPFHSFPPSLRASSSSTPATQKWAPLCGHDVSRVLAKGLEGKDLDLALVDQGLAGLSYSETVHLEKVVPAFQRTFPAVASLPPHEHQALFASEVGEGGREEGGEGGEEDGVRLHALIEDEGSSLESIRYV